MRQIAVGLQPGSSYCAQAMDQLGISSLFVESLQEGIDRGVRAFLCNRALDRANSASVPGEKVAIITGSGSENFAPQQEGEADAVSYYFKMPHKGPFTAQSFYVNLPVSKVEGETFGACYNTENLEIPNSGVGIIERANCLSVSFPWDICGYEQGLNWQRRPYFSPTAEKHFVEVGPLLDTGAFRRLLLEVILYCFNWVGLPLVRVSPFYKNKKYFSFRIDADSFTRSSLEAGLRSAEKTGLRFTWFLDTAEWRHKKHAISRLKKLNQDVQLHCFRHMTYVSEEVNDINIEKGLEVLQRNGIKANAIVSPFGYNFRGFSEAIRKRGFAYSSEFGFAVDDLPSRPWNNEAYPLQIPCHPACLSVLREAGFAQQEQFDHLLDYVERRSDFDGICILYDHPISGMEPCESLYIDLFNRLREGSYEYICMSDYYHAWLKRPQNRRILYDGGRIQVDGFQDNGFRLEQVINEPTDPVRWGNVTLPQLGIPKRTEEFRYPPDWIQALTRKKDLLHLKQVNFSVFGWHLNEACSTLGRKSGYYWCRKHYISCRRSLANIDWLHSLVTRFRN